MLWSRNRIQNPNAGSGLDHWEHISGVSAVAGGHEEGYCFKFEPTATMLQEITLAGQPPELLFECLFLPGQDISSGAKTRAEVVFTIVYGDGTEDRYTIPVRAYS